jgi:hypothetical protein
MKARFYVHRYVWPGDDVLQEAYSLHRVGKILDARPNEAEFYNSYLLGAITADLAGNRGGEVDRVLGAIEQLERGDIGEVVTGGEGFLHHITRERARFEHSVFGECPEWPIWCCTLAQYKAALQGYRRFLDMPKSIDSELIIELPDGETRCD